MSRHLRPGEIIDRGHISPLSYLQLRYFFRHHGARLVSLSGDRWKKKWIIPFALPFLAIGRLWAARNAASETKVDRQDCTQILKDLFSPPLLFSRSLVLTFEREDSNSQRL